MQFGRVQRHAILHNKRVGSATRRERQSLYSLGEEQAKRKKLDASKRTRFFAGRPAGNNPLVAENGKEADHSLNALVKIRDVKFLVRAVDVVVGKPHAHDHRRNVQIALELSDDGD